MKQFSFLSFVFVCVLCGIFACESAPKNTTQESAPIVAKDTSNYTQIRWTQTEKNFGKRKEGDVVTIVFEFENVGNKAFAIESVRPSCGCTIAEYPKEAFQPKQKGSIIAKYDSKNRGNGMIKKNVLVTGNAIGTPFSLTFEGVIQ